MILIFFFTFIIVVSKVYAINKDKSCHIYEYNIEGSLLSVKY